MNTVEEKFALQSLKNRCIRTITDYRARRNALPTIPVFVREWACKTVRDLSGEETPFHLVPDQVNIITTRVAQMLTTKADLISGLAAAGKMQHRPLTVKSGLACGEVASKRTTMVPHEWLELAMHALADPQSPTNLNYKITTLIAKIITIELDKNIDLLVRKFNEL